MNLQKENPKNPFFFPFSYSRYLRKNRGKQEKKMMETLDRLLEDGEGDNGISYNVPEDKSTNLQKNREGRLPWRGQRRLGFSDRRRGFSFLELGWIRDVEIFRYPVPAGQACTVQSARV